MNNSTERRAHTHNILIIDDEPVLRLTFKYLLEGEGYCVWVAANGRDGLDIFHKHPIDLVITDIVMPELDGFATIEALRREAPSLPIIAMSAIAGEQAMQRPLTDPAFCCVSKPLNQRTLFELVRAILVPSPDGAAGNGKSKADIA